MGRDGVLVGHGIGLAFPARVGALARAGLGSALVEHGAETFGYFDRRAGEAGRGRGDLVGLSGAGKIRGHAASCSRCW